MIHIALAQILYKPALVDRGVDFLAEPAIVEHDISMASLAKDLSSEDADKLDLLRSRMRDEYIVYIRRKLMSICSQANNLFQPDVIIFPEYSVPYQCLPQLYQLSNQLGIIIIAGSHTIIESAEEYYKLACLPGELVSDYQGFSVCPIFIPSNRPQYQIKNNRSNYEMTMGQTETPSLKRFTATTRHNEMLEFSVMICVDTFVPDVIGKISIGENTNPVIFVPACSPRTEPFQNLSGLLATNSIPTLVCNHSQYGNTGIFLPSNVRNRFTNAPGEESFICKGKESLMLVELAPDHFFTKKAVLNNSPLGSFCECCILYDGETGSWKTDYKEILSNIKECMKEGHTGEALQWAEYFTETYADVIPPQLRSTFEAFQRKLSDGGIQTIHDYDNSLSSIMLKKMHSTDAQFFSEIQKCLEFCITLYEMPSKLMEGLGNLKKNYSKSALIPIEPVMPESLMTPKPSQEQISSFRDRGVFLNQLESAVNDNSVRLILVSGAYGIGKSSAVSVAFKRNLINWDIYPFPVQGVRFSTVLEYLAELIGDPLRADTLTRQTKKILKPILSSFVKRLFSQRGRVIVVDQMETILQEMHHKDLTLLNIFRDMVYSANNSYGKIIFISDIPFPKDIFPDDVAIRRIVLGKIADKQYITRILGHEMRVRDMVEKGGEPDIPEYIYDLVNGHPLTAKLCIDVASRNGIHSLSDIPRNTLQKRIVEKLISRINLGSVQLQLMCLLSVFRTAVSLDQLLPILSDEHKILLSEGRKEFSKLSFLSVWEDRIELAAIFRSHYYDQIPEQFHNIYHEYALKYYHNQFYKLKQEHKFSGVIYTEIAYHLTSLNRLNALKSYLPGNISSLKLMAKDIYQHGNYPGALSLYDMMNTAQPDDPEILSYLGRCHARERDWEKANRCFELAVQAAKKRDEETWYLYRDWGHMNVISHMDSDTEEHFSIARELLRKELGRDDDAGILAAEGYAFERDGNISAAIEKYDAALSLNYRHEFTISRYARILREQGDYIGAKELEKRLTTETFEPHGSETSYSPFDFELIDIEINESDD